MIEASSPVFQSALRVVAAVIGGAAGALIGLRFGDNVGYNLAYLVDREPAELKDALIWGIIGSALTCAAAGVWLGLLVTQASKRIRRYASFGIVVMAALGASLVAASYDWPKSSGLPVVGYELRLPEGATKPEMNEIDITIWSGKNGHGCYIESIRMAGNRPEIVGSFLIDKDNHTPVMSLGFGRFAEERWTLPIKPDARLDPEFGPWLRIEFVPSTRENTTSLPPGAYHIRYRVRRYL